MIADLRIALRSLTRTPAFTATAVATLALGIGATTAIFSVVDAVVLRPLALPRPEALVALRTVVPSVAHDYPTLPVNARFYTEWKECTAFNELALVDRGRATLTGAGEPLRISIVRSSGNLFTTLGIPPALGRAFAADETDPAKTPVAVISDALWRERFAADPAILGRSVTLDLNPVTVIGVMPAGFSMPGLGLVSSPDVCLLRSFDEEELQKNIIGMFNYEVIGRLADGVTREEAETQLNVVAARLTQLARSDTEVRGVAIALQSAVVGNSSRVLWLLLGAISAVLALACLNIGLLGLARAEQRNHDLAVRAALGASRSQLLGHMFSETLLIATAGGLLGLLFATWFLGAVTGIAPVDLPRLGEARIDSAALFFSVGATLIATVLSSLLPAWHIARSRNPNAVLAGGSRYSTGTREARRMRMTFIGIEVAVSTMLLSIAALLIGSFARVLRADAGFQAPSVVATSVSIPHAKYREVADIVGYHRRVLDAVSATPGVTSAGVTSLLPLKGQTWIDSVHIEGDTRPMFQRPQANVRFVSGGYFKTLGIPVISGRTFRDDDGKTDVVISARLAATLWPGEDAVGRVLFRGDGGESNRFNVVGVVGDTRTELDHEAVSVLYRVLEAWPMSELSLAVRLDERAAASIPDVRRTIQNVDPDVPVQPFQTMDAFFELALANRRFQLQLVAAFAIAALTLAVLGIVGVVSQNVSQRTRELGIRLAFGAPAPALSRMVVQQNLLPILLGLAAGIAGALAGGTLVAGWLYETGPRDPVALAVVSTVLLASSLFACWLPARRVTRVNPIEALRAE